LRHKHIKVVEIGKHNLYQKICLRLKRRPPKIVGLICLHCSNVSKTGAGYQVRFDVSPAICLSGTFSAISFLLTVTDVHRGSWQ